MTREDVLLILARANASPHGLLLRSNAPERARALLYKVRKEALEPQFEQLKISLLPGGLLRVAKRSSLEKFGDQDDEP